MADYYQPLIRYFQKFLPNQQPAEPTRYVQAQELACPADTVRNLERAIAEMTACKEIFKSWADHVDKYARCFVQSALL
jgi:hypothetical protein